MGKCYHVIDLLKDLFCYNLLTLYIQAVYALQRRPCTFRYVVITRTRDKHQNSSINNIIYWKIPNSFKKMPVEANIVFQTILVLFLCCVFKYGEYLEGNLPFKSGKASRLLSFLFTLTPDRPVVAIREYFCSFFDNDPSSAWLSYLRRILSTLSRYQVIPFVNYDWDFLQYQYPILM